MSIITRRAVERELVVVITEVKVRRVIDRPDGNRVVMAETTFTTAKESPDPSDAAGAALKDVSDWLDAVAPSRSRPAFGEQES